MPDPNFPALPFDAPIHGTRTPSRPFPRDRLRGPGAVQQQERLGPRLQRLTDAFLGNRLTTSDAPEALAYEQVIVLEVAGELDEFMKTVQKIPGLEFLAGEAEEQLDFDDDFVVVDQEGKRHSYRRQLFLVASDAAAWQQLLGLWERFKKGEVFPRGLTPFRDLFDRLRDVRPWDDRDRLERTGVLDVWRDELDGLGAQLIDFEAELWLRADKVRREAAIAALRHDLASVGGNLVDEKIVEEIGYHGVLARVPARQLLDIVAEGTVRWLRTDSVRLFHAAGQLAAPTDLDPVADSHAAERSSLGSRAVPRGEPRVALLDGMPFAGHEVIAGRVVVDDPDGWDATIGVAQRRHGTAMVSAALHGDLGAAARTVSRPIYVRPILYPGPSWVRDAPEEIPRDRLPVDVIQSAIYRMLDGPDAVAKSVRVVVLAVGNKIEQFDRFISPLARLLDWLSYKHQILFVVSAGNHSDLLEVPSDIGLEDPQELQHEVLSSLIRAAGLRRILAPAESINALTIGAAHADSSVAHTDDRLEPMVTDGLPNVVSANGPGIRRAVKPDILLPGGRQLVRMEPDHGGDTRELSVPVVARGPGVRVAAPPSGSSSPHPLTHVTGTSAATALAGYYAANALDVLDDLRSRYGDRISGRFEAVFVKAALAHAAHWRAADVFVRNAAHDLGLPHPRDVVSRTLGYGRATPDTALACNDGRVTVVATNEIAKDETHTYSFPLPLSLASQTVRRRLILTLAWLTPINPEHREYRRAALLLEPTGVNVAADRQDVDSYGSHRGTLQHNVFEDHHAVPYVSGDSLDLKVTCRAAAGGLEDVVPYALLATLAVSQSFQASIYQEVRQALRIGTQTTIPVPVRPNAG